MGLGIVIGIYPRKCECSVDRIYTDHIEIMAVVWTGLKYASPNSGQ